ncbi:MAG: Hsp20/alpha crystallin family protein [Candidatus Binatia bacterium]
METQGATTGQEMTPKEKQEVQGTEQARPGRYFSPDVDIYETPDGLWLLADMPGVDPGEVSVELNDGVLTIQGDVGLKGYQGLTPAYCEYRVGPFLRRFTLPHRYQYDADKITARLVNGVLEVQIPKAESAKPRRIQVATS